MNALRSTTIQQAAKATIASEPGERMPLRLQLALLVAATMLPLIGLIAYHAQYEAALESDLAARSAEDAARRVAISAGRAIRDTRAIAQSVAQRPDVHALDPLRCDPQLTELPALVSHVTHAATLRRDGTLVCMSATASPLAQLNDTELKRIARLARPGVERLVQPAASSAPLIPITVALQDAADRIAGTLLVAVDMTRLLRLGDEATNDYALALLDTTGNVLARSSRAVGSANAGEFPALRMAGDDHGHLRARTRSGDQLFGFARVEGTDWLAISAVPARSAFAASRENGARASILGALVIVAASLLAFRFGRSIEGSVRALADTARSIAEGDRSARAPPGGSHETADIAALMNRMLDRVPDMEARLTESERNLDLVLHAAQEGILVIDANAQVSYANDAAARLVGCAAQEELIDRDSRDALPEALAALALERLEVCSAGRRDQYEVRIRAHDGTMRWLCVSATPLLSESGRFEGMLSMLSDVTERKDVGDRLARITKLYWALLQVNEAILRNPDGAALLAEACRVVVQEGEFVSAFVMLRDRDGHGLVPIASAGETAGTLGSQPLQLSTSAGVVVSVMSSGRPEIVDDFFAEPRAAAEQALAKSLGIRSLAAFPLRCESRVVGVLAVSASDVGYFDIGVTELLRQTAVDLSFALDVYEQIAKRDRTEAELRATNSELERQLSEALSGKKTRSQSMSE